MSTQPTTPSSTAPPHQTTPKINAAGRPNIPVIPIVPAIPNKPVAQRPSKETSISASSEALNRRVPSNADHLANAVKSAIQVNGGQSEEPATPAGDLISSPIKATPKSWADLVRTKGAPVASVKAQATDDAVNQTNGFVPIKAGSLADALSSYNVKDSSESAKVAFLEPRGLVNTGNMCYMNSVSVHYEFYNFMSS